MKNKNKYKGIVEFNLQNPDFFIQKISNGLQLDPEIKKKIKIDKK